MRARACALLLATFALGAAAAASDAPRPLPAGGFDIKELREWLLDRGFRAELKQTEKGREYILSGMEGLKVNVEPYDCVRERCASLQFKVILDDDKPFTLEQANDWNVKKRWATASVDQDGDLVLQMDVSISPGGTDLALNDALSVWQTLLADLKLHADW